MSERRHNAPEAGAPPQTRRESRHILAAFEARVLPRIARALPRGVLPDHLTAVGVLPAFAIGACYALSGRSRVYLWLANGLWIVNWLGDSLDGTLARVRHIERPRYGFYRNVVKHGGREG